MPTTREKFVEAFGEYEAETVERAAAIHRDVLVEGGNWAHQLMKLVVGKQLQEADDQFLLDIAWCISWQCISDPKYRIVHGFKADPNLVREWIRQNAVPPKEYRDPAMLEKYVDYLGESV